jgi:hypothetical protein
MRGMREISEMEMLEMFGGDTPEQIALRERNHGVYAKMRNIIRADIVMRVAKKQGAKVSLDEAKLIITVE